MRPPMSSALKSWGSRARGKDHRVIIKGVWTIPMVTQLQGGNVRGGAGASLKSANFGKIGLLRGQKLEVRGQRSCQGSTYLPFHYTTTLKDPANTP